MLLSCIERVSHNYWAVKNKGIGLKSFTTEWIFWLRKLLCQFFYSFILLTEVFWVQVQSQSCLGTNNIPIKLGTGDGSCRAAPFRSEAVQWTEGCPDFAPCCSEYGYCHTRWALSNLCRQSLKCQEVFFWKILYLIYSTISISNQFTSGTLASVATPHMLLAFLFILMYPSSPQLLAQLFLTSQ